MDDGGMVFSTENLSDFSEGIIRKFTDEVHGDLPGIGNVPASPSGVQIFQGKTIEIGNGLFDGEIGVGIGGTVSGDVFQDLIHEGFRDVCICEVIESDVGIHAG